MNKHILHLIATLSLFLVLVLMFLAVIIEYEGRLEASKVKYEKIYDYSVEIVNELETSSNKNTLELNELEKSLIIEFPDKADKIRTIFDNISEN